MCRHGQRGAGRLKAILWLAIMASFIYVCVKTVPVFVNEYQFQDAMLQMARFASVNRQTAEQLRVALLKEAEKNDIPLRPEDIHVSANSGVVKMDAAYTVTVDLRVYQWVLTFHPSVQNNPIT